MVVFSRAFLHEHFFFFFFTCLSTTHREHPVHPAHFQALPVDKLRHQESLWREDLQSGGHPRTTTPTRLCRCPPGVKLGPFVFPDVFYKFRRSSSDRGPSDFSKWTVFPLCFASRVTSVFGITFLTSHARLPFFIHGGFGIWYLQDFLNRSWLVFRPSWKFPTYPFSTMWYTCFRFMISHLFPVSDEHQQSPWSNHRHRSISRGFFYGVLLAAGHFILPILQFFLWESYPQFRRDAVLSGYIWDFRWSSI